MKNKFIGFYKPSVVLTFLEIVVTNIGIYLAFQREPVLALICLVISGLLDAFDGKVARAFKRSKEEKMFGVELDSLADIISFIILPIVILYNMGLSDIYSVIIYSIYSLAGVIRLAYFNIVADSEGPVSFYSGLPVTTACAIFPIAFLIKNLFFKTIFPYFHLVVMLITAFLFVLNFKLKKPKGNVLYLFLILGIVGITIFYLLMK